jgi:hypothetical protein
MDESQLSILSLIVSVIAVAFGYLANKTSKKALAQAEESASATLLKEYTDSFFEIKEKLRPQLQELEVFCMSAERDILELLDGYTPEHSRPLRHLVSDLCYELSDEWFPKILTEYQIQYNGISRTLWEYEFDHPNDPCVTTLNTILDPKQKSNLAGKLHETLVPFWQALVGISTELQKAVLFVDSSVSKSRIAGYPISKNKALEAEMQHSRKVFYLVSMLDLHQLESFGKDSIKGGYTISAFIYSVTVLRLIQRLIERESSTIDLDSDIENAYRFQS